MIDLTVTVAIDILKHLDAFILVLHASPGVLEVVLVRVVYVEVRVLHAACIAPLNATALF